MSIPTAEEAKKRSLGVATERSFKKLKMVESNIREAMSKARRIIYLYENLDESILKELKDKGYSIRVDRQEGTLIINW